MERLEWLRTEMKKRGCTDSQCNSGTAATVLDILTESGDTFSTIRHGEQQLTELSVQLNKKIRTAEWRLQTLKNEIEKAEREYERIKNERDKDREYIDRFYEELNKCETPEGRDAMKAAQMFRNSIRVSNGWENTAYINGMASILSKGGVGSSMEIGPIPGDDEDMGNPYPRKAGRR